MWKDFIVPGVTGDDELATITLHLPLEDCTIDDDEVCFELEVGQWRSWLPAFQAALDGLEPVDVVVVGSDS